MLLLSTVRLIFRQATLFKLQPMIDSTLIDPSLRLLLTQKVHLPIDMEAGQVDILKSAMYFYHTF